MLLVIGCGDVNTSTDASLPPDVSKSCNPTAKFNSPTPVPGLETTRGATARLSTDELTIYFTDTSDLWTAHRNTTAEAFGPPIPLTSLNSSSLESNPSISPDGLTLWFDSNRIATEGYHLYVATRSSDLVEFNPPVLATTLNGMDTKQFDAQPFVTADGKEFWFISTRQGGFGGEDIWRATSTGNGFAIPTAISELNSPSDEWLPTLSSDRLTVYFASRRAVIGAKGNFDIWMSHRTGAEDRFPPPVLVDELNTTGNDLATWMSADNCRMYGATDVSGTYLIYVATRQR